MFPNLVTHQTSLLRNRRERTSNSIYCCVLLTHEHYLLFCRPLRLVVLAIILAIPTPVVVVSAVTATSAARVGQVAGTQRVAFRGSISGAFSGVRLDFGANVLSSVFDG